MRAQSDKDILLSLSLLSDNNYNYNIFSRAMIITLYT